MIGYSIPAFAPQSLPARRVEVPLDLHNEVAALINEGNYLIAITRLVHELGLTIHPAKWIVDEMMGRHN